MGISRSEIIDLISQNTEYVNEIAGGFTLFLHQDASADIGGYLLLATDDPDDIKTDVGPFAITGADQELEQFATAAGEPGLTTLQHGVYELHFHAEKTAGTKDAEVYFKIYKRAAGGAETLLGTSEVTSAIGSGESEYSIHTSIIEQILLVDDRIVLKLFGSPIGLGSNPTISIYVEGTTLSRLTIPVGIGDIGGGGGNREIQPTQVIPRNGFTLGDNNVAYATGYYIGFGKNSKTTGNTFCSFNFKLPSDYVDGENMTINFYWAIQDASNVVDYLVTTYYGRDDLALGPTLVDTHNATWTSHATSYDMNFTTLTFTGTNVQADDFVTIKVLMEDDNNVRLARLYNLNLIIPVSGSD